VSELNPDHIVNGAIVGAIIGAILGAFMYALTMVVKGHCAMSFVDLIIFSMIAGAFFGALGVIISA